MDTEKAKEIARYAIGTGAVSAISILAAVALIFGLVKFSAEVSALRERQNSLEQKIELMNKIMQEKVSGAKEVLGNENKYNRTLSDVKISNLDRVQMMNNKHTRELHDVNYKELLSKMNKEREVSLK